MNKKFKRVISLMLVGAMMLSFAGCNEASEETSGGIEYVTEQEIIYVDDEDTSSDKENDVSSSTSDTSIEEQPQSEPQSSEEVGTTPPDIDKFRGTTVKFAVTSDPMLSEKAYVIQNFERETGIKIEPVIITGDFTTGLTNLIAAGKAPDVVRSSGDFPLSLTYLQSLDNAKIDYTDPIWEQGMFELSTFNGSPYLCTTEGNVYTETDIVVYRKDLLSAAGCKTPEQYDAEGKWNIDAFFEIARQTSQKIDTVKGGSFLSYESAIHMTGNAVFKIENGKFVNGMTNTVADVFDRISQAKKEGILFTNSTNGIADGSIAIATHHSYALRKTGAFEDHKNVWDKLGFYYLPSFNNDNKDLKTGLVRGWGLVKEASNPEAAGIFLRYYLDPENCDVANMYISSEAATFFFRATDIDYDNFIPYYTYGGKLEDVAGIDFQDTIYTHTSRNKAQITTLLPSINGKIDEACTRINDFVTEQLYKN